MLYDSDERPFYRDHGFDAWTVPRCPACCRPLPTLSGVICPSCQAAIGAADDYPLLRMLAARGAPKMTLPVLLADLIPEQRAELAQMWNDQWSAARHFARLVRELEPRLACPAVLDAIEDDMVSNMPFPPMIQRWLTAPTPNGRTAFDVLADATANVSETSYPFAQSVALLVAALRLRGGAYDQLAADEALPSADSRVELEFVLAALSPRIYGQTCGEVPSFSWQETARLIGHHDQPLVAALLLLWDLSDVRADDLVQSDDDDAHDRPVPEADRHRYFLVDTFPALAERLREDPDPERRMIARLALGGVDELVAIADGSDHWLAAAALKRLARRQAYAEVRQRLVNFLPTPILIRLIVGWCIPSNQHHRGPRPDWLVPALVHLVGHEDAKVRQEARSALCSGPVPMDLVGVLLASPHADCALAKALVGEAPALPKEMQAQVILSALVSGWVRPGRETSDLDLRLLQRCANHPPNLPERMFAVVKHPLSRLTIACYLENNCRDADPAMRETWSAIAKQARVELGENY